MPDWLPDGLRARSGALRRCSGVTWPRIWSPASRWGGVGGGGRVLCWLRSSANFISKPGVGACGGLFEIIWGLFENMCFGTNYLDFLWTICRKMLHFWQDYLRLFEILDYLNYLDYCRLFVNICGLFVYAIRGLIRSERSAIKTNNRENDIALFKWPNDSLIASVGIDNPQRLNFHQWGSDGIIERYEDSSNFFLWWIAKYKGDWYVL